MSESIASRRPPQVLDAKAQQADRALFAVLHRELADVVERQFRHRIEGFAAGLASDFMGELDTLTKFLLDEQRRAGELGEEAGAKGEIERELTQFLQERSAQRTLTPADRDLARQFAAEFAGSAWATIISWLDRQPRSEGLVDPQELLPQDLHEGQTPLLEQVRADASHFDLSRAEINLAMFRTLTCLVGTGFGTAGFLTLPRCLRIERAGLVAYLEQAADSYERATRNIVYTGVLADYSIFVQFDAVREAAGWPIDHA